MSSSTIPGLVHGEGPQACESSDATSGPPSERGSARPSTGLVLRAPARRRPAPPDVVIEVEVETASTLDFCGGCGAPAVLCFGCSDAVAAPRLVLWAAAVRAVCLGLVLTSRASEAYGGALLRAARAMVGTSKPSADLGLLDALVPTPGAGMLERELTTFAIAWLTHPELDAQRGRDAAVALASLGGEQAWRGLVSSRTLAFCERVLGAEKAARSDPWTAARFDLLAVVCDRCAPASISEGVRRLSIPWPSRLRPAGTFDDAIRCPLCQVVHPHPLPGARIGIPHPIARCAAGRTGRLGQETLTCIAHDGGPFGPDGLCAVGRPLFQTAQGWIAEHPAIGTRWERDLAQAIERAKAQGVDAEDPDLQRLKAFRDELVRKTVAAAAALAASPEGAAMFEEMVDVVSSPGAVDKIMAEGKARLGGAARKGVLGFIAGLLGVEEAPPKALAPARRSRRRANGGAP
jgi:hypothetical protein